ncbi:MAG: 4Fe-4S dicluster domain-containing protein [Terriglobia bacterium]
MKLENVVSETASVVPLVESLAHTRIRDCYQCGKCTAGCPMAAGMDIPPTRLIRLLQLGHAERALQAQAIWQCVSCQTCATRCPKSVDCAGVMDALRQLSAERGVTTPKQQRTVLFQKAFLRNIRRNGRLNELELIGEFKFSTFLHGRSLSFLFKDAMLAPQLMKRKKFHLVGEKAHDRAVVARIFARCTDNSLL